MTILLFSALLSRSFRGKNKKGTKINSAAKKRTNAAKIRELKQPRRRRQQKPHKFAYLTMENRIFARFARAVFIFWHFKDVLVLSTTWNDLFCSCVDDVSIWWQMFNFVFLCPKRWFQFNSRTVKTHFSSVMTLNNWKVIAETRSYIFRSRSGFRRRRVCLSSLLNACNENSFILGKTEAFSFLVFPKLKPTTLLNNDLKTLIIINVILRGNDSCIIGFYDGHHTDLTLISSLLYISDTMRQVV